MIESGDQRLQSRERSGSLSGISQFVLLDSLKENTKIQGTSSLLVGVMNFVTLYIVFKCLKLAAHLSSRYFKQFFKKTYKGGKTVRNYRTCQRLIIPPQTHCRFFKRVFGDLSLSSQVFYVANLMHCFTL
jgi:hypothetical protein